MTTVVSQPAATVKNPHSRIVIWVIISIILVCTNILFLIFIRSEMKTVNLLKKEIVNLENNQKIIASSEEIYATHKDEISVISGVFPTEETIPDFIKDLEARIRANSDEYTFKFNSITPLKEQDKLYLPMTITVKTDFERLNVLFSELEKLDYMVHITAISAKTPEDFTKSTEAVIALKLYVQNPFTDK